MFRRFPQLPFWAKVGEIPSSYKVSMSYEEQLLWLCQQIELIKSASGNIDYNALENKPIINGVTLQGTLTLNDLDIQQKLRAGNGIIIDGNIISATGGGSGGTDNYNLLNNKPSINGVILQGDKTFEDFGLQTTKTYEELTDYVDGYYFNIPILSIGENVPTPSQNANSKYMIIDLSEYPQARYRLTGRSGSCIWFTCTANPLLDSSVIVSTSPNEVGYTEEEVEITIRDNSSYLVFNFTNTDSVTPKVERIIESVGGVSDYPELTNKPSINGVTLIGDKSWEDLGLQLQKTYNTLSGYVENYYFPVNELVFINDYIPSPSSEPNSCYIAIPVSSLQSNTFRITGHSDVALWFTCSDNPTLNTSLLKSKSATNIGYTREEVTIEIPEGANYIVFNFTDTDVTTPVVEEVIESLASESVKILEANLDLNAGEPISLPSGFYNTGSYKVRYLTLFGAEDWIGNYEIFYVANNSTIISDNFNIVLVDDGGSINWSFDNHSGITNEIVDERTMIPTSKAVYNGLANKINTSAISSSITSGSTNSEVAGAKAVYDALQNIEPSGGIFTNLDNYLYLNDGDNITLEDGWYYANGYGIYLNNDYISQSDKAFFKVFKIENDDSYIDIYTGATAEIKHTLTYFHNSSTWYDDNIKKANIIRNETGTSSQLRTSIPASGNGNDVPNIDSVRTYLSNKLGRYNDYEISADSSFTTTAGWKSSPFPLELINNNLSDLLSYDSVTNTFTVLKNCKLKIELCSTYNMTSGTTGNIYGSVPRIKITRGGNESYKASGITLFSSASNTGTLITSIELLTGDTLNFELQVEVAGTYRFIGGRTYVIITEMI